MSSYKQLTCTLMSMSFPSGPKSPNAIGIKTGTFLSCPTEGGVVCFVFNVYVPAFSSYAPETVNKGVPAWPYHLGND